MKKMISKKVLREIKAIRVRLEEMQEPSCKKLGYCEHIEFLNLQARKKEMDREKIQLSNMYGKFGKAEPQNTYYTETFNGKLIIHDYIDTNMLNSQSVYTHKLRAEKKELTKRNVKLQEEIKTTNKRFTKALDNALEWKQATYDLQKVVHELHSDRDKLRAKSKAYEIEIDRLHMINSTIEDNYKLNESKLQDENNKLKAIGQAYMETSNVLREKVFKKNRKINELYEKIKQLENDKVILNKINSNKKEKYVDTYKK